MKPLRLACLVFSACWGTLANAQYSIKFLAYPSASAFYTQANCISDNGQWVGGMYFDSHYGGHGFRWSAATGFVNLPGTYGVAAISDNGEAVGQSSSGGGYYFDSSIHSLPAGYMPSSITPDGKRIAGDRVSQTQPTNTPFVYQNGQITSSGPTDSYIQALNSTGTDAVGGYYQITSNHILLFPCGWLGGSIKTPALPFGVQQGSFRAATTGGGCLLFSGSESNSIDEATFLWNGSYVQISNTALPSLSGWGMSDDGCVVAGSYQITSGTFVWTAWDGAQDLQKFLAGKGVGFGAYSLGSVSGVSGDGLTIVGSASDTSGAGYMFIARLGSIQVGPKLAMNGPQVVGGNNLIGQISVTRAPIADGMADIQSTSPAVDGPTSAILTHGQLSDLFPVATWGVLNAEQATVTTSLFGQRASATFKILPASLIAVVAPGIPGGLQGTGHLVFNGKVPAGLSASLSSSDSSLARLAPSIALGAQVSSQAFPIATVPVDSAEGATITATYRGVSKKTTLEVLPASLSRLECLPATVTGGTSTQLETVLEGEAGPSGLTVDLACDTSVSSGPSLVKIPWKGSSSVVKLATVAVSASKTVTLSAALKGVSKTCVLTVLPAKLTSLTVPTANVVGGSKIVLSVALNGPAPSANAKVSLTSNNAAVPVPADIVIAAGKTSASISVTTKVVASNQSITVTAAYQSAKISKAIHLTP